MIELNTNKNIIAWWNNWKVNRFYWHYISAQIAIVRCFRALKNIAIVFDISLHHQYRLGNYIKKYDFFSHIFNNAFERNYLSLRWGLLIIYLYIPLLIKAFFLSLSIATVVAVCIVFILNGLHTSIMLPSYTFKCLFLKLTREI